MSETLAFIDHWNAYQSAPENKPTVRGKSRGVQVMALHRGDDIFGIEIRFPARAYSFSENVFESDFGNRILSRTGGVLNLRSSYAEATNGILSYTVAFCNLTYNDRRLADALEFLLTEVLTDYRC